MIGLVLGLLGSYVIAEIYKKYTTADEKYRWEDFVKTHHGEAGAVMTVAGLAAKSPTLTGLGIGLMLHDKDDANKWFK